MFHRIVWATDGSEAADQALAPLRTLAAESDATIIVVHCKELTMAGKGGGSFPVHADEDELARKIEQQARELGAGVEVRGGQTMVGGAAHVIAQIAEEEDADLIIAATRGRTPLGGLLLGSVTQRLLHLASCPVLVIPAGPQRRLAAHAQQAATG